MRVSHPLLSPILCVYIGVFGLFTDTDLYHAISTRNVQHYITASFAVQATVITARRR